jgi:methionine sulfoxide reductase heme-binding subunit
MGVRKLLDGKPLLWGLLSIPALLMIWRAFDPDIYFEDLLHPSGEWSARLIILALMLTPLSMLLPKQGWVKWLIRRRRAFGVAAFFYASLHLLFYVLEMRTLEDMLAEIGALGIWTGWVAFLLMVPLALTSNDAAMRALRAGWKRLQRLAYPAALLTLVHWMFVHDNLVPALLNFAPLIALELWRVARSLGGHRPASTNPATANLENA